MITVSFTAATDGGVITKVCGRVAFPDRKLWKTPPKAGEEWEVEVAGENPRQTVYFLRPLRCVKTAAEREEARSTERAEQAAMEALVTETKAAMTALGLLGEIEVKGDERLTVLVETFPPHHRLEMPTPVIYRGDSPDVILGEWKTKFDTLAERYLERSAILKTAGYDPEQRVMLFDPIENNGSQEPTISKGLSRHAVTLIDILPREASAAEILAAAQKRVQEHNLYLEFISRREKFERDMTTMYESRQAAISRLASAIVKKLEGVSVQEGRMVYSVGDIVLSTWTTLHEEYEDGVGAKDNTSWTITWTTFHAVVQKAEKDILGWEFAEQGCPEKPVGEWSPTGTKNEFNTLAEMRQGLDEALLAEVLVNEALAVRTETREQARSRIQHYQYGEWESERPELPLPWCGRESGPYTEEDASSVYKLCLVDVRTGQVVFSDLGEISNAYSRSGRYLISNAFGYAIAKAAEQAEEPEYLVFRWLKT